MRPPKVTSRSSAQEASLRRVVLDAGYFGGMVGCGETYFPAFVLAIGLGETSSGIVASFPLMAGGIIQLMSPIAIGWAGSFRRWVTIGASLQALSFLPLVYAALTGEASLSALVLVVSIYWATGYSTGPAWNTWMEYVVPPHRRVRFFAGRSRVQQACTFTALLLSGLLLNWGASRGYTLESFALLFSIAGLLRLASAYHLSLTGDGEIRSGQLSNNRGTRKRTVRRGRSRLGIPVATHHDHPGRLSAARLIGYLVCMQLFVQISGPFFVPYMLSQLQFSYATYIGLVSVAFVSKVASLSLWGRVAERTGAVNVLWAGGVGLVPLAWLWVLSSNVWWLVFVQALSGVAWAAYELGFFLMFFESMPAGQRTRLLTFYNFANTLAITGGAAFGATILACSDCTPSTYHRLFLISSMGRFACLGLLLKIAVPASSIRSMAVRILSVRPGAGSITAPIVVSQDRRPSPVDGFDPLEA
jgi:hypothetical protein